MNQSQQRQQQRAHHEMGRWHESHNTSPNQDYPQSYHNHHLLNYTSRRRYIKQQQKPQPQPQAQQYNPTTQISPQASFSPYGSHQQSSERRGEPTKHKQVPVPSRENSTPSEPISLRNSVFSYKRHHKHLNTMTHQPPSRTNYTSPSNLSRCQQQSFQKQTLPSQTKSPFSDLIKDILLTLFKFYSCIPCDESPQIISLLKGFHFGLQELILNFLPKIRIHSPQFLYLELDDIVRSALESLEEFNAGFQSQKSTESFRQNNPPGGDFEDYTMHYMENLTESFGLGIGAGVSQYRFSHQNSRSSHTPQNHNESSQNVFRYDNQDVRGFLDEREEVRQPGIVGGGLGRSSLHLEQPGGFGGVLPPQSRSIQPEGVDSGHGNGITKLIGLMEDKNCRFEENLQQSPQNSWDKKIEEEDPQTRHLKGKGSSMKKTTASLRDYKRSFLVTNQKQKRERNQLDLDSSSYNGSVGRRRGSSRNYGAGRGADLSQRSDNFSESRRSVEVLKDGSFKINLSRDTSREKKRVGLRVPGSGSGGLAPSQSYTKPKKQSRKERYSPRQCLPRTYLERGSPNHRTDKRTLDVQKTLQSVKNRPLDPFHDTFGFGRVSCLVEPAEPIILAQKDPSQRRMRAGVDQGRVEKSFPKKREKFYELGTGGMTGPAPWNAAKRPPSENGVHRHLGSQNQDMMISAPSISSRHADQGSPVDQDKRELLKSLVGDCSPSELNPTNQNKNRQKGSKIDSRQYLGDDMRPYRSQKQLEIKEIENRPEKRPKKRKSCFNLQRALEGNSAESSLDIDAYLNESELRRKRKAQQAPSRGRRLRSPLRYLDAVLAPELPSEKNAGTIHDTRKHKGVNNNLKSDPDLTESLQIKDDKKSPKPQNLGKKSTKMGTERSQNPQNQEISEPTTSKISDPMQQTFKKKSTSLVENSDLESTNQNQGKRQLESTKRRTEDDSFEIQLCVKSDIDPKVKSEIFESQLQVQKNLNNNQYDGFGSPTPKQAITGESGQQGSANAQKIENFENPKNTPKQAKTLLEQQINTSERQRGLIFESQNPDTSKELENSPISKFAKKDKNEVFGNKRSLESDRNGFRGGEGVRVSEDLDEEYGSQLGTYLTNQNTPDKQNPLYSKQKNHFNDSVRDFTMNTTYSCSGQKSVQGVLRGRLTASEDSVRLGGGPESHQSCHEEELGGGNEVGGDSVVLEGRDKVEEPGVSLNQFLASMELKEAFKAPYPEGCCIEIVGEKVGYLGFASYGLKKFTIDEKERVRLTSIKEDGHFSQLMFIPELGATFAYNAKKQLLYKLRNNKSTKLIVFYDDIFFNSETLNSQFRLLRFDRKPPNQHTFAPNTESLFLLVLSDKKEISILNGLHGLEADKICKIQLDSSSGDSISSFDCMECRSGSEEVKVGKLGVLTEDQKLTVFKLKIDKTGALLVLKYRFIDLKTVTGHLTTNIFSINLQNRERGLKASKSFFVTSRDPKTSLWQFSELIITKKSLKLDPKKACYVGCQKWSKILQNGFFGLKHNEGYYVDALDEKIGNKLNFGFEAVQAKIWSHPLSSKHELWVIGKDGSVKRYE